MIPQGFNYSQSSLTAFARCRRQLLLRYVERLAWPAPLAEVFRQLQLYCEQQKR